MTNLAVNQLEIRDVAEYSIGRQVIGKGNKYRSRVRSTASQQQQDRSIKMDRWFPTKEIRLVPNGLSMGVNTRLEEYQE
jgi:hypothetical protein